MSVQNDTLPEAVRELQLRHLQLSARAENTLIRAQIDTIGALVDYTPEQLLQIRNFGQAAYQETREALLALYQALSGDQIDWNKYCQIRDLLPLPTVANISHTTNGAPQRQVYDVPESIKPLVLGHLHLPTRIYNALQRADITTVGRLVQIMNAGIFSVQGLGPNAETIILSTFTAINIAATPDGGIDWFTFWSERNIKIIPETHQTGTPIANNIHQLPSLIREILRQDGDERDWRIIERRFGLNGSKRLKLDQLGKTFGLTRERVRQIEVKALRELRAVLLDYQYSGYMYHIHPEVLEAIRAIFELIATQADEYILETNLFQLIEKQLRCDLTKSREALLMLLDMAGLRRIEFDDDDLVPIWAQSDSDELAILEQAITRIDVLLTQENAIPMEEFDILMHLNKALPKQKKLSQIQLRRYLDLCSTIERRSDGLYWAKFVYIKSRGNQAERVLAETHRPMTATEIARVVNTRLVAAGKKKVEERNFVNQMVGDNRFVPIGRSGQWALATWDVETGNIVELMERFLITRDAPATPEEIFLDVNERRKVSLSSIHLYLQTRNDLFRRINRIHWGLAIWPEAKQALVWNREQVADFIVSFFREHKVKEIDFHVLRDAFMKTSGVSSRQAAGILRQNPAIVMHLDTSNWKRYATFQPDYREKLSEKVQRRRRNATRQQQLDEIVVKLLAKQPGKQMALAPLVDILTKQYGFLEKTAYLYITRSAVVDKFTQEGTRTKICRLKTDPALEFSQIAQIRDVAVRERVEKAVRRLNVDDVDVGLFELGRDFEVMLKKALVAGSKSGKINLSAQLNKAPTEWKLYDMVNCALALNIITQKGIAHYLRQQRNDRAHGEGPSLEERKALLNSASRDAGLYINYIILFEARYHEWSA